MALVSIAVGGWLIVRDNGWLEQVTAARVEQGLLKAGAPEPLAACMAPELADRLTITQLRELEALKAEDGEDLVPTTMEGALERLRRVEDEEAVRVFAEVGTRCTTRFLREKLDAEFERQKELLGL